MNQEKGSKGQSIDHSSAKPHPRHNKNLKTKFAWTGVFIVIAGLTIWSIVAQDGFSLSGFIAFLKESDPRWIAAAFASMLGFIVFEGMALLSIVKYFGYKKSVAHGAIYASGDIYFSAITPSATGGQPASAYFMMKDKIPGTVVTVALVVNIIMYTFAILTIGVISILMSPGIFFGFSTLSKVLIIVGSVCLVGLAIGFIFILYKSQIIHKIGIGGINLLAKLKLIRKPERKKEKLTNSIASYSHNVSLLRGHTLLLLRVLGFNILQRACGIAVTLFVFLASGGSTALATDIWTSQCMVVLGSNTVPIPGAMGVSDYLLIDALSAIGITSAEAVNLDLLSRAISFYSCVILCGLAMIIRLISYKIIARKNNQPNN